MGVLIQPGQAGRFFDVIAPQMRKNPDDWTDGDWDVYRALEKCSQAVDRRRNDVVATRDEPLSSVRVENMLPGEHQATASVPEAAMRLRKSRQAVLGRIAGGRSQRNVTLGGTGAFASKIWRLRDAAKRHGGSPSVVNDQ